MLELELCTILVEAVGDEYRHIVHPRITWRGTEHDPVIALCYLQKRSDPAAVTYQTLLVEYEEGVLDLRVLVDVIPAVDSEESCDCCVYLSTYSYLRKFSYPV